MRAAERELLQATVAFTAEDHRTSMRHTAVGFAALAAATAAAAAAPGWPARLAAATLEGLLVVRCFILYHDHAHGSLLRRAPWARALFAAYGVLSLNPPRIWNETHNYHHLHTAKIAGSHIGSYQVLPSESWARLSPLQRMMYRMARHPLTVLLGYFTVFLYGMCLRPFLRSPREHLDSGLALALHVALAAALWIAAGPAACSFVLLWPMLVACAVGAYIFYAQHNFPGVRILPRREWTYAEAALVSSAFIVMGPVMRWFTGNIGYHHVHHLNPSIPFYRLPEAMAAIPALQHPTTVSLRPRDILACFKLKLWSGGEGRMVGFRPRGWS